jgi:threonine aldolase
MINLKNDYCAIAHPKVLSRLIELNEQTFVGYGLDEYSEKAAEFIKDMIKCETADVHFLVGGTITNKVVISHALKSYQAVISADSGHINVHETGTIEQSGHKVLTVPNVLGKINVNDLDKVVKAHTDEHMVMPKMVYLSNSTELGTVYKYQELLAISNYCKENNLYFFMDGARLGAALASKECDYKISDLPKLVDAFYIGGTKNGLTHGEAIVIINEELKQEFRYSIKHYGGLYAKGYILGIEFLTLFEDNLFIKIAEEQNKHAEHLQKELKKLGVEMLINSSTNQIFPIFKKEVVEKLKEHILFDIWEERVDDTVIRLVTNFKTTKDDIDKVLDIIGELV